MPSDGASHTVAFDTGSSDLFIPSTACGESCNGHKLYNPSASSTSKDLEKEFALTYRDGSEVNGEQYTDVVAIAGLVVRGTVFFSFIFLLSIHMSRHRRRPRRLVLQWVRLLLTVPGSWRTA